MDLGESFPTSTSLQNVASIQPRTSLVKFARSPCTDPPGFGSSDFQRERVLRSLNSIQTVAVLKQALKRSLKHARKDALRRVLMHDLKYA